MSRFIPNPKLRFLDQCREVMQFKRFSPRTVEAHVHWIDSPVPRRLTPLGFSSAKFLNRLPLPVESAVYLMEQGAALPGRCVRGRGLQITHCRPGALTTRRGLAGLWECSNQKARAMRALPSVPRIDALARRRFILCPRRHQTPPQLFQHGLALLHHDDRNERRPRSMFLFRPAGNSPLPMPVAISKFSGRWILN